MIAVYRAAYERIARRLIFRGSATQAHENAMRLLGWLDDHHWTWRLLNRIRGATLPECPVEVGGVRLPHPLILAAGFVKGRGFATEHDAAQAVVRGDNIIPGWRSMPLLVGAVEFGSFTRWPRLGNSGTVLWRDIASNSTQNRVGLKNPGVGAAAEFLACHQAHLPPVFGINIAASPGVVDPEQETAEILEALNAFLSRGIRPAWFTLNLSCPNTEDDPGSRQTEARTDFLCRAVVNQLRASNVPLWVKIGPGLSDEQYRTLICVFAETGVQAVIATNTRAEPVPAKTDTFAGVGGGRLRAHALAAVRVLADERRRCGYPVDIIACGGVVDGAAYSEFSQSGINAAQYWTALVYRGPLAASVIWQEVEAG